MMDQREIGWIRSIHGSVRWGNNCKFWQFCTICEDVEIGDNVVIGSNVFVGAGTKIGSGTRIQHGAFIPKNTVIEDFVFIGPNATLTDDKHPVAGKGYTAQPPVLKSGCSIGAGVTILPGVTIGHNALIGAGAVVTKDVQPFCTMVGNPCRIIE